MISLTDLKPMILVPLVNAPASGAAPPMMDCGCSELRGRGAGACDCGSASGCGAGADELL
jgi:hypothetical protein